MLKRLTDALDFQSQALVLRAERQRLIASNIANADTPGYQARDFDFASALRAGHRQRTVARSPRRMPRMSRRRSAHEPSASEVRHASADQPRPQHASTWTASARRSPTTR